MVKFSEVKKLLRRRSMSLNGAIKRHTSTPQKLFNLRKCYHRCELLYTNTNFLKHAIISCYL